MNTEFRRNLAAGPSQRLVFPLDVPHPEEALALVAALRGRVGFFKIGLELFIRSGPEVVRAIKQAAPDQGIFLDLKLHDIPATVGRAAKVVSGLGVDLTTVHGGDGQAMIRAAKEAAGQTRILAVTVLTSLDLNEDLGLASEFKDPMALVLLRAKTARAAGCDGFVCSGREVGALRKECGPDPLIVVPGIRPAWSLVASDDQKRVATPEKAIRDGADLLVVGRPIRDARDPAEAADLVGQEIGKALGHNVRPHPAP